MLAVKLYEAMPSDDENVQSGISGKIPAEVRFNVDIVPGSTFQIMTEEEYSNYLNSIQAELDEWKNIQEAINETITTD